MPDTTKTGAEGVTWDLGDLYASGADPQLEADLDEADRRADVFAGAYRGKVAGLSAKRMAGLLAEYEAIADLAGQPRLVRDARLVHAVRRRGTRRAAAESHRARLAPAPEAGLPGHRVGQRPRRGRRASDRRSAARSLASLAGNGTPPAAPPAVGARGEGAVREGRHGPRGMGALLRRGARRQPLRVGGGAGPRADRAGEAAGGRPRGAPGRGRIGHEGPPRDRAHHHLHRQHAARRQVLRRRSAEVPDVGLGAQHGEPGRRRHGGRAGRVPSPGATTSSPGTTA